jgi:cell shape-determining protein MreC
MALVDIRQRTGYLFLTLIVGHVILISTQVTTNRGVPLFEAIVFGAFSEVQRASNAMGDDVRLWWQDYFALQQVRADNTKLKEELSELRVRLQQERGAAEQSRMSSPVAQVPSSGRSRSTRERTRGFGRIWR